MNTDYGQGTDEQNLELGHRAAISSNACSILDVRSLEMELTDIDRRAGRAERSAVTGQNRPRLEEWFP